VVAFGFGTYRTHIGKEARRLGVFIVAYARDGNYQSSTCVVFTLFLNKEHWDVVVWPFILFGLWPRSVSVLYIGRERGAWDSSQHIQKAGVIRAAHAWCYFLNNSIGDIIVVRPFVRFVVAFGFGARCTSAENDVSGFIKRQGLSEQHMHGIYIIFSRQSIGDVVVWPFAWFVVVFGCGAVHQQGKRRLGFIKKLGLLEQHMRGIYIIFSTKYFRDVRLCSVLVLYIHRQRLRRLGFIAVFTQEAGIIRAANAWYFLIIFSTQGLGDVIVCLRVFGCGCDRLGVYR